MTYGPFGRAVGLAMWLLIAGCSGAFAHALPGSTLVLWQEGDRLALTITLALEDLVVASPQFTDLEDVETGHELSAPQAARVAAYLEDHVDLRTPSTDLEPTLVNASLATGENAHVGRFTTLIATLVIPLPERGDPFPLTLVYDAVMHEVRNHRATVYWGSPGTPLEAIADFGFRNIERRPRPVLLTAP